jgi:hypothetical protein
LGATGPTVTGVVVDVHALFAAGAPVRRTAIDAGAIATELCLDTEDVASAAVLLIGQLVDTYPVTTTLPILRTVGVAIAAALIIGLRIDALVATLSLAFSALLVVLLAFALVLIFALALLIRQSLVASHESSREGGTK